ncbi:Dot/Icm T4SS effector AnkK/LegA5 [Legionella worsleiensis]|uniref:Cardiac ankyrin repeat-containing protein n=1 Tax=Legionella worsleiensis TaxID=45076 RepID=A0A0W1AHV3_9GAMM|nr:Dot/Icm T4SS effector AnkK/LegA5 [Legionella worsleiensis]KTD80739.1 cardiac ankyrin repeat-containing protein [Legionella worsleiensis]STY32683.1 ankyrin [Legionella worsleiensis]
MVSSYNINAITLAKPLLTGHEVYPDALYTPPDGAQKPFKLIFKKNKHGNPQFSRLEIAFSALASLFMLKNSTPRAKLVLDDSERIVGLGIEHLCYVVENNAGLGRRFYFLDPSGSLSQLRKTSVQSAVQIPLYFLDKLPSTFFQSLVTAHQSGTLSIDFASLASIFASSFTLEEDDLHKGNFGFYLVEDGGKPRVVFFKIDHDLMFADSIMSFYETRLSHYCNSDNAFNITARDLLNFPYIRDSANSYWPTKPSLFPNPWNSKEYRYEPEVASFAQLRHLPEFKKAKWLSFYKHILLTDELIKTSLTQCLDEHKAIDKAQIAQITQAAVARQAQLRAVLFSIKEFRLFLLNVTADEKKRLLDDIIPKDEKIAPRFIENIENTLKTHQDLCHSVDGIDDGDTPLHIAIKLGDYRYEETLQKFGHLINEKNNQGKTPLDCALDKVQQVAADSDDVRQDIRFTMRHLLEHGAIKSKAFQHFNRCEKVEDYKYLTSYLDRVIQAASYQQFKDILCDIGEDHRFCLKSQKNLAIACVSRYLKSNRDNPELKKILVQLKHDINGHSTPLECAGLFYIRQLRSRLWIVRKIRGLMGWTTTQGEINALIDREHERLKPEIREYFSFFTQTQLPLLQGEFTHSILHIPQSFRISV